MKENNFLDEKQREEINDLIERAVVAGKASASNLAGHILEKIDDGLQKGIEKYVNGHMRDMKGDIDGIKKHLVRQDEAQGKILLAIETIKTDTTPLVDGKKWAWAFFKGLLWTCGAITAIGSAWFVLKQIFK